MIELKLKYNELIKRFNKAEAFMNDENVPLTEKKKWLPQLIDIMDDLSDILNQLKDAGFSYTTHEVLTGFNVSVENAV